MSAIEVYKEFTGQLDAVPEYDVLTVYEAYTKDDYCLGIIVGRNKREVIQAARYRFGGSVYRLHPTGEKLVDWRT
jgi:hypothetical protein